MRSVINMFTSKGGWLARGEVIWAAGGAVIWGSYLGFNIPCSGGNTCLEG